MNKGCYFQFKQKAPIITCGDKYLPETQMSTTSTNNNIFFENRPNNTLRFSGLSNSIITNYSLSTTDDSLMEALRAIPVTPPNTLFIQPSIEEDTMLKTPPLPLNNNNCLDYLLKSFSTTAKSIKTVDKINSNNNTVKFPYSQIPSSPLKDAICSTIDSNGLISESQTIEGKKLDVELYTQYSGHEPINFPDSFVSEENPFGRKVHFATSSQLNQEYSDSSKINNNMEEEKVIVVSPTEVLKKIDDGVFEKKYKRQIKSDSTPLKLVSTPQLKAISVIKEKQHGCIKQSMAIGQEDLMSKDKIIIGEIRKKGKSAKEPDTKKAIINNLANPINKKEQNILKKKRRIISNDSSPKKKDEKLKETTSSLFTSPRTKVINFRINDLVWIKWKYDLYLVGKLESKPSSTRNLWNCKYLFQNKLSLPHCVTPNDILPLKSIPSGNPIVNVLSKSRLKLQNGTFEKFYTVNKQDVMMEVRMETKQYLLKLKSIAIHRNVFLNLKRLENCSDQTNNESNNGRNMFDKLLKCTQDKNDVFIKQIRMEASMPQEDNYKKTMIRVGLTGSADKKSVKERIKKLNLVLVEDLSHANILISEGAKRTAKYLQALLIPLPIVNTAWLFTNLTIPSPLPSIVVKNSLQLYRMILLGSLKFQKEWHPIIEELGGVISDNNRVNLIISENEKYKPKGRFCAGMGTIVLLASELAEMIVNSNFTLLN